MTTDTVEWGSERGRPRRVPRLGLAAPPHRHAAMITGGLAALGFALTLTGELLPWLEIKPAGPGSPGVRFPEEIDTSLHFTQLFVWQAPAYYMTLTALLVLTALALIGRPRLRRAAAAAAVGAAAGQAVLLAGVFATMREGRSLGYDLGQFRDRGYDQVTGDGFYSAVAGLVLLAVAAVLAGWWAAARHGAARPGATEHGARWEPPEPGAAGPTRPDEPLDLTVAPATPFEAAPDGSRRLSRG